MTRILKLDLDRRWTACGWLKESRRIAAALALAGLGVEEVTVRETRHGFHVLINLAADLPSEAHVVALQAILGSDARREALNLGRVLRGERDWNVLFETKNGFTAKPRIDAAATLARALREQKIQARVSKACMI